MAKTGSAKTRPTFGVIFPKFSYRQIYSYVNLQPSNSNNNIQGFRRGPSIDIEVHSPKLSKAGREEHGRPAHRPCRRRRIGRESSRQTSTMAARKSCTHLTWADAKAKVGGDGGPSSKKPLIPKKIDHGKALTAKVIAKNGASQRDISKEKMLARRARRGEERAAAAAAKRAEEKEMRRKETMVKPFDVARNRMIALADKLQREDDLIENEEEVIKRNFREYSDIRQQMAECRELQANEILGLEAIYNTNSHDDEGNLTSNMEFRISNSSRFDVLQQHLEQWQMDTDNEEVLQNIAHHPPLSFTIQLVVDGSIAEEDGSVDLVCLLLVRVTLPPFYPSEDESSSATLVDDNPQLLPTFGIEYFVCTHRDMKCTPDKPLESLALLDEIGLTQLLAEEAKHLLPDPCAYMVVTSCLTDRLFDFVKMSVQGRHAYDQYLSRNEEDL
ncbi:hypothetical protein ACHAWF_006479 [Thalassiosira exigua]